MNYAMILNNKVIEVILDCDNPPNWPPDPLGNKIIAIPCDNTVERGMDYDFNSKTFINKNSSSSFSYEKLKENEERQIDILLNTEYIICLIENYINREE